MADETLVEAAGEDGPRKKGKKGPSIGLAVGIVLLAALMLAAAFVWAGGAQYIADTFGIDFGLGTKPSTSPPATSPPASTPTTPAPSADLFLDDPEKLFWEQVDSQEQIGRLVRGEVASLTVGATKLDGDRASIRVQAAYVGGGELGGVLVLEKADGLWFFVSMTREGNVSLGPEGRGEADMSVVTTIIEQQSKSQDIVTGLVDGEYETIDVLSVERGSGTATIAISLKDAKGTPTDGEIVCVTKEISGKTMWFITAFRKS